MYRRTAVPVVQSLAIVVAENSIVGHFSFGGQTALMKEYYLMNRNVFSLH